MLVLFTLNKRKFLLKYDYPHASNAIIVSFIVFLVFYCDTKNQGLGVGCHKITTLYVFDFFSRGLVLNYFKAIAFLSIEYQ